MNMVLLKNIEKDIKQHFFFFICKLTYKDGIQLIIDGYDERMEEIAQYCKQQLETELGKTFIFHHCKTGMKPKTSTKGDIHLYRFTPREG